LQSRLIDAATPQSNLMQSLQCVSASADLSPGKSRDPGQHALGLLCQNQLSTESVESGADAGMTSSHQMTSVFAVFNCNRFECIQAATSARQSDRRCRSCEHCPGCHEPYTQVSSAYRCGLRSWPSTSCVRSAVYSKKRIGPKTDPCGTPYSTSFAADRAEPNLTYCVQPFKYDVNQR